eukprot:jgi/Ulvmu1/7472/UM037_0015.1
MSSRFVAAVVITLVCLTLHAPQSAVAIKKPDYSLYHTEKDLVAEIQRAVEQTSHLDLELQSHSNADNYTAEVPVVTFRSPLECPYEQLRLLLVFGEHAREFVSSELGLYLIQLLGNFEDVASHFGAREWSEGDDSETEQLIALLKSCVSIKIVPIENRGGRQLIEQKGDLCERKNGNGVDPNRNWGVDWGKREKDYSKYEENAGTHAFSEPEPFLLRDIVHSFQPHIWVNVHTGMEGLFMPFDHQPHIPDDESSQHTMKVLERLNEGPCNGRCAVGSGGQQVGYLAHGTATDYVYLKAGVRVAMTWEIYGDLSASYMDCFRSFNPTTEQGFHALLQTWSNAVFELLLSVRDHPDFAHLQLSQNASQLVKDEEPLQGRVWLQTSGQGSTASPEVAVQYVWGTGIVLVAASLAYVLLRVFKAAARTKRVYA